MRSNTQPLFDAGAQTKTEQKTEMQIHPYIISLVPNDAARV